MTANGHLDGEQALVEHHRQIEREVVAASARKARERAKLVEWRMSCPSSIDKMEAFKGSLAGGSSGTIVVGVRKPIATPEAPAPKPEPLVPRAVERSVRWRREQEGRR